MLKYYNNITKTLTIPCKFNEEFKDIPTDTEIIIFHEYYHNHRSYYGYEHSIFNQEIKENVLPGSLHTLIFGEIFNQEIKENVLPYNLHTLTFGTAFNQEIKENVLPDSLHTLNFGRDFNQKIKENVLPNSLHTITFGYNFNKEIKEKMFPCSIKNICLWSHCNLIYNLPLRIEEVNIMFAEWNDKYNKEVNNLPMTLEKIIIEDEKYLKYITKIPFGCDIVIQKID
jgi:hypothetical protein